MTALPQFLARCPELDLELVLTDRAVNLVEEGIDTMSLNPDSFIETAQLLARYEGSERHQAMLSNTPMGRLGRPEEIAALALFLCSDDASFITGSNFPIEKLWTSYGELIEAHLKATSRLSNEERSAIFHDTAARLYRLE